jgi:hypothetical protein
MATATTTFPGYEKALRELVVQHRKLKGQRVILAVYFAPQRKPFEDVCLFEVIEGFGPDEPEPDDADLFQFGYGSTPGFPLPAGVNLRLVLTNPHELRNAISGNWKAVGELRAARQSNEVIVLYSEGDGEELWESIP